MTWNSKWVLFVVLILFKTLQSFYGLCYGLKSNKNFVELFESKVPLRIEIWSERKRHHYLHSLCKKPRKNHLIASRSKLSKYDRCEMILMFYDITFKAWRQKDDNNKNLTSNAFGNVHCVMFCLWGDIFMSCATIKANN
jgi:hypothetical protein